MPDRTTSCAVPEENVLELFYSCYSNVYKMLWHSWRTILAPLRITVWARYVMSFTGWHRENIYTGTSTEAQEREQEATQSTRAWWRDTHTSGSASSLYVHCNICHLHTRAWRGARGSADGSPRADQLFLFIQYTCSLSGGYNTFSPPSTYAFAVHGCL